VLIASWKPAIEAHRLMSTYACSGPAKLTTLRATGPDMSMSSMEIAGKLLECDEKVNKNSSQRNIAGSTAP
jgi:hypothetical protein